MWFRNQYGKTPQDAGLKTAVARKRRLFFFGGPQQVVYAPNPETAAAFIKVQTILETIFSSCFIFFPLIIILIICTLAALAHANEQLVTSLVVLMLTLCLLGLIINIACYFKCKPLEKIYQGKIITYTA